LTVVEKKKKKAPIGAAAPSPGVAAAAAAAAPVAAKVGDDEEEEQEEEDKGFVLPYGGGGAGLSAGDAKRFEMWDQIIVMATSSRSEGGCFLERVVNVKCLTARGDSSPLYKLGLLFFAMLKMAWPVGNCVWANFDEGSGRIGGAFHIHGYVALDMYLHYGNDVMILRFDPIQLRFKFHGGRGHHGRIDLESMMKVWTRLCGIPVVRHLCGKEIDLIHHEQNKARWEWELITAMPKTLGGVSLTLVALDDGVAFSPDVSSPATTASTTPASLASPGATDDDKLGARDGSSGDDKKTPSKKRRRHHCGDDGGSAAPVGPVAAAAAPAASLEELMFIYGVETEFDSNWTPDHDRPRLVERVQHVLFEGLQDQLAMNMTSRPLGWRMEVQRSSRYLPNSPRMLCLCLCLYCLVTAAAAASAAAAAPVTGIPTV
jgi:hypothetical protein